jgi:hypothetical protein
VVRGELGPVAGCAEVDDPVVRDAGVGVLGVLDGVIGALGGKRDDLDREHELPRPQDAALALAAFEASAGDDGKVRPAYGARARGRDELQVDVDVREHIELGG